MWSAALGGRLPPSPQAHTRSLPGVLGWVVKCMSGEAELGGRMASRGSYREREKSQPHGLRDCETPAVILKGKRRTSQPMGFCSNCWEPSPGLWCSLTESRCMASVSSIRRQSVPWAHAHLTPPASSRALEAAQGPGSNTESCLPEVEGARHKARRAVIPLLKMPRTHTSIETENTLVVARHRGREDASDRARHRLSF